MAPQSFWFWLALATSQNIMALAALGLPAENFQSKLNFNSKKRRSSDIDLSALLSFCRECGPIKIIVLFMSKVSTY